jgi:hypothetical protein
MDSYGVHLCQFAQAKSVAEMLHSLVRTKIGRWSGLALLAVVGSFSLSFFVPFLGAVPAVGGALVWGCSVTFGFVQFGGIALFVVNVFALFHLRRKTEPFALPQIFTDMQIYLRRAAIAKERLQKFDWSKLQLSDSAEKAKKVVESFLQAVRLDSTDAQVYKQESLFTGFAARRISGAVGFGEEELCHTLGLAKRVMDTVFDLQNGETLQIAAINHLYEVIELSFEVVNGMLGNYAGDEFAPEENPYANFPPYCTGIVDMYLRWWDPNQKEKIQSAEEFQRRFEALCNRQQLAVRRHKSMEQVCPTFTVPRFALPCGGHPRERELLREFAEWKTKIEADVAVIASGQKIQVEGEEISWSKYLGLENDCVAVNGKDLPRAIADVGQFRDAGHTLIKVVSGQKIDSALHVYEQDRCPSACSWSRIAVKNGDFDPVSSCDRDLFVPVYCVPVTSNLGVVNTVRNDVYQIKIVLLAIRDSNGYLQFARGEMGEDGTAVRTHPWTRFSFDGMVAPTKQAELLAKAVLLPGDSLEARAESERKEKERKIERRDIMQSLAAHAIPAVT